jgi:WD40 repeat protein
VRHSLLTGQTEATYTGPASIIAGQLALHPDGRTLVTSAGDQKLRFWDAATAKEKLVLDAQGAGTQIVGFFASGRTLVTRSSQGGQQAISFWRGATDAEVAAALDAAAQAHE